MIVILFSVIVSLFINGAVTDETESVLVKLGDSVTLHTDTVLQSQDVIFWRFGDTSDLIAKLDKEAIMTKLFNGSDGRFTDRLKINPQNGDLTIANIKSEHTGVYHLQIRRKDVITKTFNVSAGVFGDGDEVKKEFVMEGDSVTLHTDVTDIQKYDLIEWWFQNGNSSLAKIDRNAGVFSIRGDVSNGGFGGTCVLNLDQTGALTIKNIKSNHSGLYEVDISRSRRHTIHKSFRVSVSDEVTKWTVTEGDSVTLPTNVTDIQTYDVIQWLFGDQDTRIAEMYKADNPFPVFFDDEIFKNKLDLKNQTGDLTITHVMTQHSGRYDFRIISSKRSIHKRYIVTITARPSSGSSSLSPEGVAGICLLFLLVSAAGIYYRRRFFKMKQHFGVKVPVVKGEAVYLQTHFTDLQTDDVIEWRYRSQNTGLARMRNGPRKTVLAKITDMTTNKYEDVLDGKFRGRLEINSENGDLTINDLQSQDSGIYKLKINSDGNMSSHRFYVNVCDEVKEAQDGQSVSLHTGVTDISENDQILWWFGDKNTPIAQIDVAADISNTWDGDKGLFKDKLQLNRQTGDLTINCMKRRHSGVYKLKTINRGQTMNKTFYVIFSDRAANRRGSLGIPLLLASRNDQQQ